MNCREFTECVCEVIDKRLGPERTKEMLDHATLCAHCKYEYESLQTAKNIVHKKIHRKSVPSDVYYSILNATVNASGISWFRQLFSARLNPALAFVALAVIAVGAYSLFTPNHNPMSDEANIISQSLKNYQAVVGGSIKPDMVDQEENVRSYLEKEVQFAVNVPKMPGCNWCGGVLSNFKGVKLAHVVYGMGGEKLIYIYQADMKQVMEGTTIGLPDDVKEELLRTDWYIKEFPDSITLVMWRYENTLCAAVSKMGKDQLVALLTSKELQ